MKKINNNKCLSVKSKKSTEQCPYIFKSGCMYCGIHKRSKKPKNILTLPDLYDIGDFINKPSILLDIVNKTDILDYDSLIHNLIDTTITEIKTTSTFSKDYDVSSCAAASAPAISSKSSADIVKSKDINRFDISKKTINYTKDYIRNIIKIQSLVRKNLIFKRNKCNNKIDCITMDTIYDIPSIYFYEHYDAKSKLYFGFDIRCLSKVIESKYKINPYTNCDFSKEELEKIKSDITMYKKINTYKELEKDKLTAKQELEAYVLDVFHLFDLLGYYTDMNWFLDLGLKKLHRLYYESQDMFYYRLNLPKTELVKYADNGHIFIIKYNNITSINDINDMRYIILNEYNKLLTYSKNKDGDKKTVALWLLLALMEVSDAARAAMPHLIV